MTTPTHPPRVIRNAFRQGPFTRFIADLRLWNARRRAIRQLSALPDALLEDIGIQRYRIREAVYGPDAHSKIIRLRRRSAKPTVGVEKPIKQAA